MFLRPQVLVLTCEGHPGIVSMKQRLRSKLWWPGTDKEAEKLYKTCPRCQLVSSPANPEPIKSTSLPSGPWQDLAIDLLHPLPSEDCFSSCRLPQQILQSGSHVLYNIQEGHVVWRKSSSPMDYPYY